MHEREAAEPPGPQRAGLGRLAPRTTPASAVAQVAALQHTIGNSAVARLLQRRVGGVQPDAPAAETTSTEVTGRYEVSNAGDGNRFTLQLNQSGRHLDGWVQRHVLRTGLKRTSIKQPASAQELELSHLEGELLADDAGGPRFEYSRTPDGHGIAVSGTLYVHRQGDSVNVFLDEGSWSEEFTRVSSAPRLSEAAIESVADEDRPTVRATETMPLDPRDQALVDQLAGDLRPLLKKYFAGDQWTSEVIDINVRIRETMERFAQGQKPAAIHRLHLKLSATRLKVDKVERSSWDWLQQLVDQDPGSSQWTQRLLDMAPSGTGAARSSTIAATHRYSWQFVVVGGSLDIGPVGGGAFLGMFTIQKLAPNRWAKDYFTVLGEVSAGLSVGVGAGSAATGTFETPHDWRRGDFPGWWEIRETSVIVGAVAFGPGTLIFHGDGTTHPQLEVDGGEASAIFGAKAGAEFAGTSGWLFGSRAAALRSAGIYAPMAEADYVAGSSTHFEVDDPSLTSVGRDAIRHLCAIERAAFESPASTLEIDGYASTTGREARNERLAELRAQNVHQAILDAMASSMRAQVPASGVRGHGEAAARAHGSPDDFEDLAWRRVDVRLNGRLVLTLH